MLEKWLTANGFAFTTLEVDEDPAALEAMNELTGGRPSGVPFTAIETGEGDDKKVTTILGYDVPKFKQVLGVGMNADHAAAA